MIDQNEFDYGTFRYRLILKNASKIRNLLKEFLDGKITQAMCIEQMVILDCEIYDKLEHLENLFKLDKAKFFNQMKSEKLDQNFKNDSKNKFAAINIDQFINYCEFLEDPDGFNTDMHKWYKDYDFRDEVEMTYNDLLKI